MFKWIAGGLAALFSIRYLSRLQKASTNITSRIRVRIHKVNLMGIELKAMVQLQNPNPVTLRLQHPFVKILHKNKLLGSSTVENTVIEITENSQKDFDLYIQSAGWLTLIQILGTKVASDIRLGNPIQLNLQTQIITRVNGLPYEQTDTITLQL
ncbi:hypothetical protein D1818_10985 [Aquimarina sp. BL5]|uniref:hypothetical protein n=1 Tax=Aquimarina sp. BL5 TaxID=1714860 RepID=UPI000E4E1EA3|nr:hypothetical protein [Aquimarina sp. BL5]AXT51330.1 hypothetical protein D1818_10985 [Aquimarina sp. BL5]RKN09880.1 hypothetical protein D7036_03665 [Aquimarina sp. BL5]